MSPGKIEYIRDVVSGPYCTRFYDNWLIIFVSIIAYKLSSDGGVFAVTTEQLTCKVGHDLAETGDNHGALVLYGDSRSDRQGRSYRSLSGSSMHTLAYTLSTPDDLTVVMEWMKNPAPSPPPFIFPPCSWTKMAAEVSSTVIWSFLTPSTCL